MSSNGRSPTKTQRLGIVDPDRRHRRAERLRVRLGPGDLAGVDRAVDRSRMPSRRNTSSWNSRVHTRVRQHADLDPASCSAVEQRHDVRVGLGVRLPELLVRRERALVPLTGRLDPAGPEDVVERAAALVLPAGAPGLLLGATQRRRPARRPSGSYGARRRRTPTARARSIGVPRRERAAPVEDHRLDRAVTGTTRRSRRAASTTSPTGTSSRSAVAPVLDLDRAVGERHGRRPRSSGRRSARRP